MLVYVQFDHLFLIQNNNIVKYIIFKMNVLDNSMLYFLVFSVH